MEDYAQTDNRAQPVLLYYNRMFYCFILGCIYSYREIIPYSWAHYYFISGETWAHTTATKQGHFLKQPLSLQSKANANGYFFLRGFSIAACAAANRAIGTRKGEQLT